MQGGENEAGSGKDAAAAVDVDVDASGSAAPLGDGVAGPADGDDAFAAAAAGNGDATRFDSDLMGDCSSPLPLGGMGMTSVSLQKLTVRFTGVCCS